MHFQFEKNSDMDISAFVPPSCKRIAKFKTPVIEKIMTTSTPFVSTPIVPVEETFVPIVGKTDALVYAWLFPAEVNGQFSAFL